MIFASSTHRGKIRELNEDSVYVPAPHKYKGPAFLMAVADGMGGHNAAVQQLQNLLGIAVFFDLHDCAHAVAVGFVADIGDGRKEAFFLLAHLENALEQIGLVDLVRQLCDDDAALAVLIALDLGLGTQLQPPAAAVVVKPDTVSKKQSM